MKRYIHLDSIASVENVKRQVAECFKKLMNEYDCKTFNELKRCLQYDEDDIIDQVDECLQSCRGWMVTDDGKEVMSEGGYQIIPFRALIKELD